MFEVGAVRVFRNRSRRSPGKLRRPRERWSSQTQGHRVFSGGQVPTAGAWQRTESPSPGALNLEADRPLGLRCRSAIRDVRCNGAGRIYRELASAPPGPPPVAGRGKVASAPPGPASVAGRGKVASAPPGPARAHGRYRFGSAPTDLVCADGRLHLLAGHPPDRPAGRIRWHELQLPGWALRLRVVRRRRPGRAGRGAVDAG
jgi:hypothetical protein